MVDTRWAAWACRARRYGTAVAEMEQGLPSAEPCACGHFTHFCRGGTVQSEDDAAYTAAQHDAFSRRYAPALRWGAAFLLCTAAIPRARFAPEYHHDMVRAASFRLASSPRRKQLHRASARHEAEGARGAGERAAAGRRRQAMAAPSGSGAAQARGHPDGGLVDGLPAPAFQ